MKPILFFLFFLSTTAMCLSQTGNAQRAAQNYRYKEALTLLENEPETPENLLLKASCCEKLYDFPGALILYRRLLQSDSTHLPLLVSAAECALRAGNTEQALKYWIRIDSLSPGNLFFQTRKTAAYYRNGNWKETLENATTVFETDSVPMLLRMAGDAYLYISHADSAIAYYVRAIRKNPSDHQSVVKLGNLYYAAKSYGATLDLTDRYLTQIDSTRTSVGQLNGMAHYSEGNYKEAAERLKQNLLLGDSSYTTCYYLGMSLYASDLYFESVEWLQKAYEKNNTVDLNLLFYYGTALSRTYDRKRGIEVLLEGVGKIEETNEKLYDFDLSLANAHQRSKAYGEAVRFFKSAYKRRPDTHRLLYSIASNYDSMKDYKSALNYYERFLKTAPADLNREALGKDAGNTDQLKPREIFYRRSYRRIKELREELFFQSGKR